MWKGFVISLTLHILLAVTFVGVWHLLPLPPMRPIRISIIKHAPSRQDLGLTPDGRLPEDQRQP